MVHLPTGTPVMPEAHDLRIAPSTRQSIDEALTRLSGRSKAWISTPVSRRLQLVRELVAGVASVAEPWVAAAARAKGLDFDHPTTGEEWQSGPALTLRMLRLLENSLRDLLATGRPQLPNAATRHGDQTRVRVFPNDVWDSMLYLGISGEVRFLAGVEPADVAHVQAAAYRNRLDPGVALVLGAGNISSIPATDMLTKLFVDLRPVALKMNPVNEYLGPIFERAFSALTEAGLLAIVYGGRDEGRYLIEHDAVTEIHLTGSDKTHDAIVFGTGTEGATRKTAGTPIMKKELTSELGNVTPVIVVPGPWSSRDHAYQAENLASMLTHNAGFNCIATRVVITHSEWNQRRLLLDNLGKFLSDTQTRRAYYPGAHDRLEQFVESHPHARTFGAVSDGELPWTLIEGLDPNDEDNVCFHTEAFASVKGEVQLGGESVAEYLDAAVDFCNDTLWGTLGASIIVHPRSLKDRAVAAAVERAIDRLRYGTIGVNLWSAVGFAMMSTPWGAYPGHTVSDIQSGTGHVHNTLMLGEVEKTVARGPWRAIPKPVWFPTNRTAHTTLEALTSFEASPSIGSLLSVSASAIRG